MEKYLDNRPVSHLVDELTFKKPKNSLVRDLTEEELVEKHAV